MLVNSVPPLSSDDLGTRLVTPRRVASAEITVTGKPAL